MITAPTRAEAMVGTIKATKEVAEAEEVVTDKMTKIHTAEVEVEVEVEDRRVDMGAMIRTLTEEVAAEDKRVATAAIKTHTVEVVVVVVVADVEVEVEMEDTVSKMITAPETRAEAMVEETTKMIMAESAAIITKVSKAVAMGEETTTKTIMAESAAITEVSRADMAVEMLLREEAMEVAEDMEIQTMI